MAGFGTAEKAIVNASAYSTLMGKYYQWIFVVFRFFLALSMAKSVTGDSEKDLECDTKTIGCQRMCHNMFFPMSLGRYWQLQIFCISLPAILFMAYKTKIEINIKAHIAKTKEAEKALEKAEGKKPEELTETEKLLKTHNESVLSHLKFRSLQAHVPARLFLAYYFHIWARMIFDIVFTVYQYRIYIFKFIMPEAFTCEEFPCKGGNENLGKDIVTRCFIKHSIQRTVFINLNFCLTCITIILSFWDLYTIGFSSVAQAWYKRDESLAYETDGPVFLSGTAGNADGFIDTRGLGTRRQISHGQSLGFVQSSGVNYRISTMNGRQPSILRSRSRIYR